MSDAGVRLGTHGSSELKRCLRRSSPRSRRSGEKVACILVQPPPSLEFDPLTLHLDTTVTGAAIDEALAVRELLRA